MDIKGDIINNLIVWLIPVLVILLSTLTGKSPGVGLVVSYCFANWLAYWLGGFFHSLPWTSLPQTHHVALGLRESTYGMVAFGAGAIFAAPAAFRLLSPGWKPVTITSDLRLPWLYIVMGFVNYLILAPTIGKLPSLNALTAVGGQLIVVGLCLLAWKAWHTGGHTKLYGVLFMVFCYPLLTVLGQGFLGFGIAAVSAVMLFVSQFYRPRIVLLLAGVIGLYAGLSFFVAYMQIRTDLRAVVWGGESMNARMEALTKLSDRFDWFDIYNDEHLLPIDERLNQAPLVGACVELLSSTKQYVYGETIVQAVIGLIPRVIWPSKPMRAGSGDLVSRFTGIEFAEGTSVGIGQIMEFHANGGTVFVVIGMFLFGILLGVADRAAAQCLAGNDWQGFARWYMPSMALLQCSGSLFEVMTGLVSGIVVMKIVNQYAVPWFIQFTDGPAGQPARTGEIAGS